MDYINYIKIYRYNSFQDFYDKNINANNRLILATTKSSTNIFDFKFQQNDFILFGMESAGVPDFIHQIASERITIKMKNGQRSLNIAISCGIFLAIANNNLIT